MKKIFYLASIAALAFSSCAKDETTQAAIEDVKGGSKIVAAMEADDTRTHLETTNGKDFEYRWSLGDQLGIYGYGENTLSNAAFVLDNASDNSPVGVFTSQHKLSADKAYMAVYPRFAEPLFDVVDQRKDIDDPSTLATEKYKKIEGSDVIMKILPEQKYQDETFYTTTAPSISGSFAVNANGEATIGMQPVADYLMVNLTSTEPIKTLTLKLRDRGDVSLPFLKISGESALAQYWFNGKDGMEYRYFIPEGDAVEADFGNNVSIPTTTRLDKDYIVLKTDESYKTVACHEPNTYVFTIPAGILGMGGNIEAWIWVNAENPTIVDPTKVDFVATDATLDAATFTNVQGTNTNFQMNSASAKADKKNPYDRFNNNETTPYKQIVSKLENTVFWVNKATDANLDNINDTRTSFMYNPNGDVVIEHEAQLLQYIVEYNNNTPGFAGKDAFLCSGATFDFSKENMSALATELKIKNGENNVYEHYIADYLKSFDQGGGFPCFNDYQNAFIGNGAQIINIYQPLKSPSGIFGGTYQYPGNNAGNNVHYTPIATRAGENVSIADLVPSINDVTFANIEANYTEAIVGSYADLSFKKKTTYGYILAASFDGKISNVTVTNAHGGAVMGVANVAQLKGLTMKDNDKLCNIFDELTHDASVDLTETWADLATVEYEIFEYITPADNVDTDADNDLNVITVDNANASYAKLTYMVDIETDHATAVVLNDVSYWTGDSFPASKAYKVNNVEVGKYIRYAEELAAGLVDQNAETSLIAKLDSDMNLNYANLQWYASNGSKIQHYPWHKTKFETIDGSGYTVSDVQMVAYDLVPNQVNVAYAGQVTPPSQINDGFAPFDAPVVKNITLNNVAIDVNTLGSDSGLTVPTQIAGVSVVANTLSEVKINNVAINAYRADGTNNTQANYNTEETTYIGWVTAQSNNARVEKVTVNGALSTAKGIVGAIAQVVIGKGVSDSAQLTSVAVSGVSNQTVAPALTKFTEYINSASYRPGYNAMGTVVGAVFNRKSAGAADIKFYSSGRPVFLYNTQKDAQNVYDSINVLYENVKQEPSLMSNPLNY